ncbi:HD domain-containing protein [Lactococcus insecticola]
MTDIMAFAKKSHADNHDGHGYDHVFRVYHLAEKILMDFPEDAFSDVNHELVLAAALLHDTYDEKLVTDVAAAKANVADFLTKINFDETLQKQLFDIIDHLSFSDGLSGEVYPLDINGQIVQDADRLDAIGAFGIARTLQYGFARNRELYNPDSLPQTFHSKADYHGAKGTTINHFYEKLFLISATLHTKKAQEMAVSRDKIMLDFVSAIKEEYADVYGD